MGKSVGAEMPPYDTDEGTRRYLLSLSGLVARILSDTTLSDDEKVARQIVDSFFRMGIIRSPLESASDDVESALSRLNAIVDGPEVATAVPLLQVADWYEDGVRALSDTLAKLDRDEDEKASGEVKDSALDAIEDALEGLVVGSPSVVASGVFSVLQEGGFLK